MKYIFIILICFLGVAGYSQPIQPRANGIVTVLDSNLFTGKALRVPVFLDTTTANTYKTLDSSGKIIYTYSGNTLWYRSVQHKWILVGSGGGSTQDTVWVIPPLYSNATFDSLHISEASPDSSGYLSSWNFVYFSAKPDSVVTNSTGDSLFNYVAGVVTYAAKLAGSGGTTIYTGDGSITGNRLVSLLADSPDSNYFRVWEPDKNFGLEIQTNANETLYKTFLGTRTGTTNTNLMVDDYNSTFQFNSVDTNAKIVMAMYLSPYPAAGDSAVVIGTNGVLKKAPKGGGGFTGWDNMLAQNQPQSANRVANGNGYSFSMDSMFAWGFATKALGATKMYYQAIPYSGHQISFDKGGANNENLLVVSATGSAISSENGTGNATTIQATIDSLTLEKYTTTGRNRFAIFEDSISFKIKNTSTPFKIWNLENAAGTKSVRYNPTTGVISYSDTSTAGGGSVVSVSGTTNRITSTGGATPVLDISASYVGQSSITTLGTVTTGVWNGTAISNANLANSTISGISLGSNLNNLSIAAELISGGATTYNGSAAKSIAIQSGSVTNTMLAGSIDLTTKVTGTLPVANGGTGVTSSTGSTSVVLSASPTLTGTVTTDTIKPKLIRLPQTAGAQTQGTQLVSFDANNTAVSNGVGWGSTRYIYSDATNSITANTTFWKFSGFVSGSQFQNPLTGNNAALALANTGTTISRNIADANTAVIISNANASSTGNIVNFSSATSSTAVTISIPGVIGQYGTFTAIGTTGAQTINKPTGVVNFAAAATSLVVTNSLVTTSSVIMATIQTNDATMKSVQCVPASGSFTIYANAAATGTTAVYWEVKAIN